MLNHNIPGYRADAHDFSQGPNLTLGFGAVHHLAAVVMLFVMPGPLALLAIVPVLVFWGLYLTSDMLSMNADKAKYWKRYKALSAETRSAINLSKSYVKSLPTGSEWNGVMRMINTLKDKEDERQRVMGFEPEYSRRLQQAFDERTREIDNEIRISQEVEKELRAKGLT